MSIIPYYTTSTIVLYVCFGQTYVGDYEIRFYCEVFSAVIPISHILKTRVKQQNSNVMDVIALKQFVL